MNRTRCIYAGLMFLIGCASTHWLFGAEPSSVSIKEATSDKVAPKPVEQLAEKTTIAIPQGEPETKYTLRYKFKAGETLRWEVEHRAQVRTTVSGTTQTAETTTSSVKAWKVLEVNDQGATKFVHSVESVRMLQKLTGRQDVTYDSRTDAEPPVGFQDVAKAVGVPLSIVTIDVTGKVIEREEKQNRPSNQSGQMTVPLPDEAIPVGHRWSVPYDMVVTTKDGGSRSIKLRQQMTLVDVSDGIATISIDNQVLTPVNDPAAEAQLVQSETSGKIRFDIKAGRMASQISDCDKSVVGFQGEASSLHYVTRFTENLLSVRTQVTRAGPPAPPKPTATAAKPEIARPTAPQPTTTVPRTATRPGTYPTQQPIRRR